MHRNHRIFGVLSIDVLAHGFLENECLVTMGTFVRAFTGMDHRVTFENLFLNETAATHVTTERFLSYMINKALN